MTSHSPLRLESMHGPMRRRVIQSLGLLSAAPWLACAESSAAVSPLSLPLHVRELVNHIGTSVPDVTRSATFYSHLFQSGTILGQEKPALRYEINFHPGALSIGPLRSAGAGAGPGASAAAGAAAGAASEQMRPYIDHFAILTQPFDATAWRARLVEEKVRNFAAGSFVVIGGLSVQLLGGRAPRPSGPSKTPPPAAAAGGFNPMPPLFNGQPLVNPHGFEHLTLQIADLDASAALFRRLFGLTPHTPSTGRRLFQVADIRLELREAPSGERPVIEAFAIRVAPFDAGQLRAALERLGATVEPVEKTAKRTILRFADPDGINCELWA